MHLFHRIDDAQAIVRVKNGVYKQAELYRRRGDIYLKHGGGFVRILQPWGGVWGTSAPNINVLEMPADNTALIECPANAAPKWTGVY